MKSTGAGPIIHLAFRFHVNFYHSYRGDLPDETGFGKDIRIIRGIIRDLDTLNQIGIPVRGTWDIDNFFSLETIIPTYCPDILESWQRRVNAGTDEINIMSYNNGIVSAHTEAEFIEMLKLTMSNEAGSGLNDLFDVVRPVVRPQEMMFTPSHIGLYKKCGVEAISLFYSGVPFNAFSNFMPKLPLAERFNPLTLRYEEASETMTLLPAYNHGDIGEHLTLKNWIRRIRKRYRRDLKEDNSLPRDLLILIDLDADDDFWAGKKIPVIHSLLSTARGLRGIVESIADLPFVRFTTPWTYLSSHEPVGTVEIRQDTADGGFDGYSCWAEKITNHELWSGIERSRLLESRARRMLEEAPGPVRRAVETHLTKALHTRIRALSTTHFGLSMPVMNVHRLNSGRRLVDDSVEHARTALRLAESEAKTKPRKQKRDTGGVQILNFPAAGTAVQTDHSAWLRDDSIGNGLISLCFDNRGNPRRLLHGDRSLTEDRLFHTAVRYGRREYPIIEWKEEESFIAGDGIAACKTFTGTAAINRKAGPLEVHREYEVVAGFPYLYVTTRIHYPGTPAKRVPASKVRKLGREFDARWKEVMPCEIGLPALEPGKCYRIWKHNLQDHISSYDVDYHRFSRNSSLSSFNNHITNAWIAVSDGEHGLLVAQSAEYNTCFAFCPMRTTMKGNRQRIFLNPFGTYWGPQLKYQTGYLGIGKAVTLLLADQLNSAAPSYSGKSETHSLLIAPYSGDGPPEQIQSDAAAFHESPAVTALETDES